MLEAMWTVKFVGTNGAMAMGGGGIIVFESGRIFGGDSSFTYIGNYELAGGRISAAVDVSRYDAGLPSVVGLDKFTLRLSGEIARESFSVAGHVEGDPRRQMAVQLRRIAELP